MKRSELKQLIKEVIEESLLSKRQVTEEAFDTKKMNDTVEKVKSKIEKLNARLTKIKDDELWDEVNKELTETKKELRKLEDELSDARKSSANIKPNPKGTWGVYKTGGSTGEKQGLVDRYSTKEDAEQVKLNRNSGLSKGERAYYKLKYTVKELSKKELEESSRKYSRKLVQEEVVDEYRLISFYPGDSWEEGEFDLITSARPVPVGSAYNMKEREDEMNLRRELSVIVKTKVISEKQYQEIVETYGTY